jgi:hypothetical protein
MPATTHFSNKILDLVFGGTAYSARPTTLYFALFTVAPTIAGTATEVTGGSYARKGVAATTTNFPKITTIGTDTMKNAAAIQWASASADWGTVVAWGIYDAATGGNLLFYETLSSSITITNGQRPSIAANAAVISLANSNFGYYLESYVLNHIFASVAFPSIPTHHYGLGKTTSDNNTLTGLSSEAANGVGYARISVANNKTTYGYAADQSISNASAIAFAAFTGNIQTGSAATTHFAVYTSGGVYLMGGDVPSITIAAGTYQWVAGTLNFTLN